MTFQVQQHRSTTPNKRPSTNTLLDGQLAVNFNADQPGLFFKNDVGGLVKVGPCAVSTSAPNPTGGNVQLAKGEMWVDPTSRRLYVYDGTIFQQVLM